MRWWKFFSILTLALAFGALGCGSSSSTVSITVTPTTASVITNTTQQFSALVTGNANINVTWTLTCPTNVPAPACGTINSTTGLYTAPTVLPTVTTNGTTTVSPTASITATSQADTTKYAIASITIITGISITITPSTVTIGTGQTFNNFVATVNNPGCVLASNPTCQNVTWSLPAGVTTDGTIDPNTGAYTAPSSAPSPNSISVTATSVADKSVTSTALVTIVTAADPTVISVSPNVMALGAVFQDTYITGTNFISTNRVFVNGLILPASLITQISSSLIRIRIPDFILAAPPPSGILQVTVAQQTGPQVGCTVATDCQIAVQIVPPALVGPSPDSVPQGTSGVQSFSVDGGFFGTATNPTVSASFDGQLRAIQLPAAGAANSTRQLSVTIGGNSNASDFAVPGLYPVAVQSGSDPTKFAVANFGVQPNYIGGLSAVTKLGTTTVGTKPSDVSINPATGIAVVANTGSDSVSLVDLTSPSFNIVGTICTGTTVAGTTPCPSGQGPASVSVDYVRNLALVVNQTSKTIAVVDLNSKSVSYITQPLMDTPGAVGINPVTGRALVAMQTKGYGLIFDVTQTPPAFVSPVTISTGNNTHVAVEPHLNWAIATPGGVGSMGIVDLSHEDTNSITALSRTTNVVTVTVAASTQQSPQPPLLIQLGDTVEIQGATVGGNADSSFDGFYTVTSLGPGISQFQYTETGSTLPDVAIAANNGAGQASYSQPVAIAELTTSIQGISINTETRQAVLLDPSTNAYVEFFSLLDQSVGSLRLQVQSTSATETGTIAGAFNPLTNSAVVVNPTLNKLSVISPGEPPPEPGQPAIPATRLYDGGNNSTGNYPVAVAVDPGPNRAVVVNQNDGTVSIYSLGPIQPLSITDSSPKTFVATSTLTSAAAPSATTLTVLGYGFSSNSMVRLDGIDLATTFVSGRQLTAVVPPTLLATAHRYALDVQNSGGETTNSETFTVEQSVDVHGACSSTPYPAGVSVDPLQNLVAVSLEGCNSVVLINLRQGPAYGTGTMVTVGSNPVGVATFPRLHMAVVANAGSGNASVVDELGQTVVHTVVTASGSVGVGANQATGEAAVANSGANTVSTVNVVTGGSNSLTTGQNPVSAAINDQNDEVAIADAGSNTLDIGFGGATTLANSFSVQVPTSVVYDPVPADCGPTNTLGCFLVASSVTNSVNIIDPLTSSQTGFRVGINPTAIAYNYLTSTLVSTNTLSRTISVADFLSKRIRAVLTLPPTQTPGDVVVTGLPQFAVDIHPFTNLAVIADTANGRVLFVPLPR